MTDPINTYTRPLSNAGANGSRATSRLEGSKGASEAGARIAEPMAGAPRPAQGEQLELSETARRTMADPSFDCTGCWSRSSNSSRAAELTTLTSFKTASSCCWSNWLR
jgi:hypothetical protein